MAPSPATPAGPSSGGALGSPTAVWRELETAPLTGLTGGRVNGVGLTGDRANIRIVLSEDKASSYYIKLHVCPLIVFLTFP